MEKLSKHVHRLLKDNPILEYDTEKEKVICRLTGFEMVPREDVISGYVLGKSYQHLAKKCEAVVDADVLRHIDPDPNDRLQATCQLTLSVITNTSTDISRHVDGKRFKKALLRWKECQESGETFQPKKRKRTRPKCAPGNTHPLDETTRSKNHRELLAEKIADDEFSDLYPAKYFEEMTLSDDDDDDDQYEDMDDDDDEKEDAKDAMDTAITQGAIPSTTKTKKKSKGKKTKKVKGENTASTTPMGDNPTTVIPESRKRSAGKSVAKVLPKKTRKRKQTKEPMSN